MLGIDTWTRDPEFASSQTQVLFEYQEHIDKRRWGFADFGKVQDDILGAPQIDRTSLMDLPYGVQLLPRRG